MFLCVFGCLVVLLWVVGVYCGVLALCGAGCGLGCGLWLAAGLVVLRLVLGGVV